MVVPYIKKEKEKKEDISSAQGSCLCGVWEGRLVDSLIFGEVDSRNGGALHIIEKKNRGLFWDYKPKHGQHMLSS